MASSRRHLLRVSMMIVVVVASVSMVTLAPTYANHVDPDPGEDPQNPIVTIFGEGEGGGDEGTPIVEGVGDDTDYAWLPSCADNYPGVETSLCLGALQACPREGVAWSLWAKPIDAPESNWSIVGQDCLEDAPPGAPPTVTDGDVLAAVRRLGLPRLTVQVQPAGETLVNFETIFFAEPPEWARTVQLLGYSVDIEATVGSYDWMFGDGTTAATTTPGAPYPSTDVVHQYADAHVTVRPRVDVDYEIRYRVDGGQWLTIDETVPAQGYATDLLIREATAVLVGGD